MTDDKKNTVSAVAWMLRGVEAGTIDKPLLASTAGALIQSTIDNNDCLLESVVQFMSGLRAGILERTIAKRDPVVLDALNGAILLVSGKLE